MKLKELVQYVWRDRKYLALAGTFASTIAGGVLYPSQLHDTPPPFYTKAMGHNIMSLNLLGRQEIHFENTVDIFPYKIKAVYRSGKYEDIAVQHRRNSKWCYITEEMKPDKCDLPTLRRTQNFLKMIISTLQKTKP